MHGYLCYTLNYNLMVFFYFLAKSFPTLVIESFFSQVLCPFVYTTINVKCIYIYGTCLLSGSTRCSRLISSFYVFSAISPISPCYFYYKMTLKNKICILSVLIATEVSFLWGPLREQRNICIYTNHHASIYTFL